MSTLADFGAKQFHAKGWDPFFLEPPHDHAHDEGETCDHPVLFADLSLPLALYDEEVDGKTVAAHYLEAKGKYLAAEDKQWMEAQTRAKFSLWQLVALGDESRVTLKNCSDGSEVTVVDSDLAAHGDKDEVYLGRIVTFAETPVLTAVHPEIVMAESAQVVIQELQAKAPKTQRELVAAWNDVVYEEEDDQAAEDDAVSAQPT